MSFKKSLTAMYRFTRDLQKSTSAAKRSTGREKDTSGNEVAELQPFIVKVRPPEESF